MKIILESASYINDKEEQQLREKIDQLNKYKLNSQQIEVYFRKDDGTGIEEFISGLRLHVPGKDLFVENPGASPMEAFSKAYKSLEGQIRKYKDRLSDNHSSVRDRIETVYNQ